MLTGHLALRLILEIEESELLAETVHDHVGIPCSLRPSRAAEIGVDRPCIMENT
jgi:hypothetical protein